MLTKTIARLSLLIFICLLFFTSEIAAQWQPVTPAGTANMQAITQHNGYVFASGAGEYFFRSSDGGQTWQGTTVTNPLTGSPYLAYTRRFVARGNTLYAVGQYRVFKTDDNGQTWEHVLKFPFVEEPEWSYGQQFAVTDTSFLLNIGRIVRYRFSTQTWEDVFLPSITDSQCRVLESTSTGICMATGYGRFYQSNDGGNTWSLSGQIPNGVASALFTGDTIISVADYSLAASELYRSFNGGQTWEALFAPRLNYASLRYLQGKLYALPTLDSTKAFVSNDLGKNWATLITSATPPPIHDLTVLPDGTLLAAEKNGVLKSTDNGQHWQYSNMGLPSHWKLKGRNGLMWAIAGQINHFSTDGGRSWQSPFLIDDVNWGPPFTPVYVTTFGDVCRHRSKWYASAPMQGVTTPQGWGVYSSDGDLSRWTFQRVIGGINVLEGLFSAGDFLITHLADNCAYRFSIDGGLSFQSNIGVNNGSCNQLTDHKNRVFGLHQTPGTILYVDTSDLDLGFPQFQWDTLRKGLPDAVFTGFAKSDNRLVVFSAQKIALSDDAGSLWHDVSGNLPVSGAGIQAVALAGDTIMTVSNKRIWVSLGNSGAWTDITGSFPETPTAVVSDGKSFVAVGHLNGWYRISISNLQIIRLQGLVFVDENLNGIRDAGDQGLPNALIQIGQTSFLTANKDGQFEYQTFFSDSIRVVLPTPYASVTPPVWYLPAQASVSQEFAVQLQPKVRDLSLTLTRTVDYRPGFEQKTFVAVRNRGTVATAGEVQVFVSKQVKFLTASPAPDLNFGDSVLVWQTGGIPLLGSWQAEILSTTRVDVSLGTLVQDTGFVKLVEKDTFPGDNFFSEYSPVIGSFDPNDKLVSPAVLPSALLLERPPLTYTIRFQNTGTASAIHVRILDTLAADFNASALQVLAASHPMTWRLSGRVLEFFFENIQLPDSTSNEPGSHGFVQFSLRPGRLVAPNEVLRNRAAIYFDFNAPVITDFAELPVPKSVTVREIFLTLCPNQDSYEGIFYPTVGTVTKILPGQWVDTQQVVHVNWYPLIPTTRLEAEVCPGDTLYGHVWQTPGNDVIYRTETAANGCDSLIEYLVKINWDFHPVWTQLLNPGESLWGIPCYSDTVLVFPGTTQKGCDSTVTVYVTMIVATQFIEQELLNISISPNPASDQAHLIFENPDEEVFDVWLETADGRIVRQFAEHRPFPAGKNHLSLHLDGLPLGIWVVVMRASAQRRAVKLFLVKT